MRYVLEDKLDNEIRAVFIKLIRTLYVDKDPYEIIKKPELVIIFEYDSSLLEKKPPPPEKGFFAFLSKLIRFIIVFREFI
jgi:hypothetical protein